MAGSSPGIVIVRPPKMGKYQTLILNATGTPGSKVGVRTIRTLAGYGVADEVLGIGFLNWNQELGELVRLLPSGLFCQWPRQGIPGLPHGFRDDPKLCERTRQHWHPFIERAWEELHRRSAAKGLACGAVLHLLTPAGGHLPTAYESVRIAQEHMPDALHLGIWFLPTDDRKLWSNLRAYSGYPDDLGIPLVVVDNRHRERIDRAIPMLLASLIFGQRNTDKGAHTYTEVFAALQQRSRLFSLAEASVELPLVPLPWWKRPFMVPGLAEQEVQIKVADLL
ncbi:MAG: hypothetical protein ACREMY_00580, partial [bacterium]